MTDLLGAYNFVVTLDPGDAYLPPAQARLVPFVAAGAFQEVKGLGADLEVVAQPEGGVNDHVHLLPVRHTWSRIALRHGVARAGELWAWYLAGLSGSLGARRDGCVMLLTANGAPAIAWVFRAGLASKWQGPEFNAMQGAVALEGLEIAHEGLRQIPLGLPGL